MSRDQVSGLAPIIRGQNLEGTWLTIQPEQFNQPVLIYFFAEWCPICKVQHSVITSLDDHYRIIGIAMQSGNLKDVQSYARQQQMEFTVINDRDGAISRAYGVNGVPASFIIDPRGNIRFSTRGYATFAGLWSRLWLSDMLGYETT